MFLFIRFIILRPNSELLKAWLTWIIRHVRERYTFTCLAIWRSLKLHVHFHWLCNVLVMVRWRAEHNSVLKQNCPNLSTNSKSVTHKIGSCAAVTIMLDKKGNVWADNGCGLQKLVYFWKKKKRTASYNHLGSSITFMEAFIIFQSSDTHICWCSLHIYYLHFSQTLNSKLPRKCMEEGMVELFKIK